MISLAIGLGMNSLSGIDLSYYIVDFGFNFLIAFQAVVFFLLLFFLIRLLCLLEFLLSTALQTYVQLDFVFAQILISKIQFSFRKTVYEFDLHLMQPIKCFYPIQSINIFAFIHLEVLRTNIVDFFSN